MTRHRPDHFLFIIAAAGLPLLFALACPAQNVSGYGTMANPHLFLVREPAVQEDLTLTEEQQQKLRQLNERLDGALMSIRNKPDAGMKFDELTSESEEIAATFLSAQQLRRLRQIDVRIRGWRSLLLPDMVKAIGLEERPQQEIEKALKLHAEAVAARHANVPSGASSQADAETKAAEEQSDLQKKINQILTAEQKKKFSEQVGDAFALERLRQVAFKAPDLAKGQAWINSEPLSFQQLKGKVVALHFFAFA